MVAKFLANAYQIKLTILANVDPQGNFHNLRQGTVIKITMKNNLAPIWFLNLKKCPKTL